MDIEKLKTRIAFVDVEASGLMHGSFPVEVAWCSGGVVGETLIRPHDEWDRSKWDPVAQEMHGLTYAEVMRSGRPVKIVASRLREAFSRKFVFSDNPEQDAAWLAMVHDAAGVEKTYRILGVGALLSRLGLCADRAYGLFERARHTHPSAGRARAGVTHLKAVFEAGLGR